MVEEADRFFEDDVSIVDGEGQDLGTVDYLSIREQCIVCKVRPTSSKSQNLVTFEPGR